MTADWDTTVAYVKEASTAGIPAMAVTVLQGVLAVIELIAFVVLVYGVCESWRTRSRKPQGPRHPGRR